MHALVWQSLRNSRFVYDTSEFVFPCWAQKTVSLSNITKSCIVKRVGGYTDCSYHFPHCVLSLNCTTIQVNRTIWTCKQSLLYSVLRLNLIITSCLNSWPQLGSNCFANKLTCIVIDGAYINWTFITLYYWLSVTIRACVGVGVGVGVGVRLCVCVYLCVGVHVCAWVYVYICAKVRM
jgi:hypothetical protein